MSSEASVPAKSAAREPWNAPLVLTCLAVLAFAPLILYVVAANALGPSRNIILIPAIPAMAALYAITLRKVRTAPLAIIGATLIFFWLLMAILAPFLPLADPNRPVAPFATPGSTVRETFFLLGADLKGRDMLSRVLWGGQRVIVWGISATAAAYIAGICAGLAAGYWRGWVDTILSFIGNIALSFPVMVLFIVILNVLGPGGYNIIIAVTFASAPAIMRIVRAMALDLRERDYIRAAQMRGEGIMRLLFVEMLPNMRGPLLVDACLRLGYTIVAITALTFLGLGLRPPDPDWGLMIAEASRVAVLWKFAYMILVPAIAVSSLVLGFNLLADGLDDTSPDARPLAAGLAPKQESVPS